MDKITTSEIEKLIKKNVDEMGYSLSDDKMQEIKNSLKQIANQPNNNFENNENQNLNVQYDANENNYGDNVEHTQETNPKELDLIKKETELNAREEALEKDKQLLNAREEDSKNKEEELKYRPQLPSTLSSIEPEEFFLFDEIELNVGAETLKEKKFNLLNDPKKECSIYDLWLNDGNTCAKIFKVKFEEIGNIKFDPFNGTAKFEHKRSFVDIDSNDTMQPQDTYMAIEKARMSQIPKEEMIDAIEPVKDVSLPMSDDMGLDTVNAEDLIKKRIDDILKNYLIHKNSA